MTICKERNYDMQGDSNTDIEEYCDDKPKKRDGYALNINALQYYVANATFEQFKEDMFPSWNDDDYVSHKYKQFLNDFNSFLESMGLASKRTFASACMNLWLKEDK